MSRHSVVTGKLHRSDHSGQRRLFHGTENNIVTTRKNIMRTIKPSLTTLLALPAAALLGLSVMSARAANPSVSYSTTAPTPGANDIYNFAGAAYDANNIGGGGVNVGGNTATGNGNINDGSTYVAGDRAAQGQTFLTGSSASMLSSISVQMTGYTANNVLGANGGAPNYDGTFWNLNSGTTINLRVGTISGSSLSPVFSATFDNGGSGTPGQSFSANGTGTWLTFTLATPLSLAANTTYGFDLAGASGTYFEWLGLSNAGGNNFADGTAYGSGAAGVGDTTATALAGARVFDLGISTVPEPS